jgi:hypothetical protein
MNDEFEEVAPEALPGSVSGSDIRPADELLLSLVAGAAQLHVLLTEADKEDFRRLHGRVSALRALFDGLPTAPSSTPKTIGFKSRRKR